MKHDVWCLADVAIPELALVREVVRWFADQDHSRWVFRLPKRDPLAGGRDLYLKIWNPTYVRRDNLLRGIDAGFYDDRTAPALKALIFHRGVCRGYVMDRCRPNRQLDAAFYGLVKERTARTHYFHIQFSPYHMMRYERAYSLIDLEGIYPLADLLTMPLVHAKFDWPDYERFVRALFAGAAPPSDSAGRGAGRRPSEAWRQVARTPLRGPRAIVRIVRRWMATTRGTVASHTHLIERS